MAETDDRIDPYRVLQVDPTADHEVIQAAYRALARRFHPDVAPDLEAARQMAAINAAFDLIRDADRRTAYDRDHGHGHDAPPRPNGEAAAPTPPPPAAGPPASDASWTSSRQGASWEGTAGPPPGRPSGSVLDFGRFKGWSLGEIARVDPGYLMWLDDRREGARFHAEIDEILHKMSLRRPPPTAERKRGGPFRRG
ncbi:MAG TPA: DnaJ domain-containing protein [Candidatus Limnocylindrales bacterium]|jgi:curved DNA-binding protein CbpA